MVLTLTDVGVTQLNRFYSKCKRALSDVELIQEVIYDRLLIQPWGGVELARNNEWLLDDISESGNLYAILAAPLGTYDFHLKYIGQVRSTGARQRLRNHLFAKNKKTGAKLKLVQSHVLTEATIAVTWIFVEPEELRHYIEERLIEEFNPDWNDQGKSKN